MKHSVPILTVTMAMALVKFGLCLVLVMKAAEAFWGVKTSPPHPGPVPSPEKFYPYLPMSQEVWEAYHIKGIMSCAIKKIQKSKLKKHQIYIDLMNQEL